MAEWLSLYVLRNSGIRVWVADRLVAIAGALNPQRPWKRPNHNVYAPCADDEEDR